MFIPVHVVLTGFGLLPGGIAFFSEVPFLAAVEAGSLGPVVSGVCLGAAPLALLGRASSINVHWDWSIVVLSGGCGGVPSIRWETSLVVRSGSERSVSWPLRLLPSWASLPRWSSLIWVTLRVVGGWCSIFEEHFDHLMHFKDIYGPLSVLVVAFEVGGGKDFFDH